MTIFFAFFLGVLLAGAACAYLIGQLRKESGLRLADKDTALDRQIEQMRESCEAQLREKERHVEEQKWLLAQAEKKLSETFDALSARALKAASDQFLQTADLKHQAFEEMLRPVQESLFKIEKQHAEIEQRRVSAFESLERGLDALSREADQLANALRKPATRGAWGEMNLKVILDNAGMQEGLHYSLQDSTEDDEGSRLRTDVIIHLPNGRDFVIDAKTPLDSYWDGMNAADEATRSVKFAGHARVVRDHMKKLSGKSYWSRYKRSPDCVVMFVPTEGAYQAAIEADRTLLEDARQYRVYLANPMTLVSMIHIAAFVLREDQTRQNVGEIQEAAEELYRRVGKFVGDFESIGRHLKLSVASYNAAVGSLEGRVLPKAREIGQLGAGSDQLETVDPLESSLRELTSPEHRAG